jgi:hypothetical protein
MDGAQRMAEQPAIEFPESTSEKRRVPLNELALFFLRLGTTAFEGPAAHIAIMEEELVIGDSGFLVKNSSTCWGQAISSLGPVQANWPFISVTCAAVGEVC